MPELGAHPIEITPPPDFIAGVGFDGFAVYRGVIFHAAAESSGLSKREDDLAVLAPAVFPTEFNDPHPYRFTESGEARIGRRWRVVFASWVMLAHHVPTVAAPVAALAKSG